MLETWETFARILNGIVVLAFISANITLFLVFMLPVVNAWTQMAHAKPYYNEH